MTELALATTIEAKKAALREAALEDLTEFLNEAVDRVRADGKPSDFIAMVGQLSKLAGLDAEKADKYAGLPMVNIVIGSNMSVSTTIATPDNAETISTVPLAAPALEVDSDTSVVIDVEPKHVSTLAEDKVTEMMHGFDLLNSAMVLPDDE